MRESQYSSSTEFPDWNPSLSFGRTRNELLKTVYIGIIEGISDTLNARGCSDAMTRELERIQSMLFSVSHPSLMLAEERIQKKLVLFYAYCQHQVKLTLESQDFSHISELPGHFNQLVKTIELCPIDNPPELH